MESHGNPKPSTLNTRTELKVKTKLEQHCPTMGPIPCACDN